MVGLPSFQNRPVTVRTGCIVGLILGGQMETEDARQGVFGPCTPLELKVGAGSWLGGSMSH